MYNYIDQIKNIMITDGFLEEKAEKYTINLRELESMIYIHNIPIYWYYKIIENKYC